MEVEETKTRVPSLLWIPLIVCVVLLFLVDVFQINYNSVTPLPTFAEIKFDDKSLKGFSINTPGCKIPDMHPYDESIRKFIEIPQVPICNNGTPALFESNQTSIYLLNTSLAAYNISDINDLKCCYRSFWRIDPVGNQSDDRLAFSNKCYAILESACIQDEFVEITCNYENVSIYKDMFSFVPVKDTSEVIISNPKALNVLVVGLDAVSRVNLHRQMPRTLSYLKTLGAVELLGYNKVADNTFPNLIPVLTGLYEQELVETCWPNSTYHFDNCHFIWQDYKRKGFMTAYGEDSSWMGLFNYQRRGFMKQSTDYGYSYFNSASERYIGNSHIGNVNECVGARQVYKDLLEYIQKFVTTMDNNDLPYFSFFWGVSLSHDYLNKPKLGDKDYTNFFKSLKEGGHLNNTALIFMSDHGIRWGGIRQTYQGRMEERLPFVIMVLPDWYKIQFPRAFSNLKTNTRRLTTPFDLHETLVDLLNSFELDEEYLKTEQTDSRGISFFREISKKRNCEEAGIVSHWCTCQQSVEIDKNSTEVIKSANFVVQYINQELEGFAQCATLTLDTVFNARMVQYSENIEKGEEKTQDVLLTLKTEPGEGIFEVTVRYFPIDSNYSIMGTISRLNLYGKQSACITDFHLKLYCYCKSLLG